jgi:hypothetical protein
MGDGISGGGMDDGERKAPRSAGAGRFDFLEIPGRGTVAEINFLKLLIS